MGYTTEFEGEFLLDRPLRPAHAQYLQAFEMTRRMKRLTRASKDKAVAEAGRWNSRERFPTVVVEDLPDPLRMAVDLPVGPDGAYFVGGAADQDRDKSFVDYNRPPEGQPGLWCQWEPNENGTTIRWDGGEKFYHYVEWLQYLVHHFLAKWGYVLSGTVRWRGEERGDVGTIIVKNNEVTTTEGHDQEAS